MKLHNKIRLTTFFTALLMIAISAQATTDTTLYIDINGLPQALVLTPRNVDRYGVDQSTTENRFYNVTLKDSPESAGRAAYIDGQWQGLLMHEGQLHLIDRLETTATTTTSSRFVAQTLNQDMSLGQCGHIPSSPFKSSIGKITPRSLTSSALQINYDSFCTEKVEGVCLVGELTLVFDSEFESDFGSSYKSQAIAIAEYVDLIYLEDFSIVFNKLRMAFGAGDQFGGGKDIEAVLDDMTDQRIEGDTASFDPNVLSILHFISGRDYFDNGPAIGIAYGPSYTSYPTPDDPLLCSGYAIGTSQVYGSGSSRTALTSIIVAHEIGHNFGFLHDGVDPGVTSCDDTDFIMAAQLNPSASEFSSCSHEAVGPNLNAIDTIEDCFNFPIEASFLANSGNPTEALPGTTVSASYAISGAARSDRLLSLSVRGDITTSAGTFISADIDGSPCNLTKNDTRYVCVITDTSTHTLNLEIQAALSDLNITHQIASTSSDDYDVKSDNNMLKEIIIVDYVGSTEPDRSGSKNITDNLDSKGSGGAFSWMSLNLIILLMIRRRQMSPRRP